MRKNLKRHLAVVSAVLCASMLTVNTGNCSVLKESENESILASAIDKITIADMPIEYQAACDWIWENRIQAEQSMTAWNTIYDQIIAGNGTLNYIVRWQSYQTITLQQRQQLQQVLEKAVNDWNDWLTGFENWNVDHVTVNIVGWAVLDKNCLLDLQEDEKVYTDTEPYDPSYDIQAGMGNSSMLTLMPSLPVENYRYEHWNDPDYIYPDGYENRFDMHLTASTGLIDMGGYGYSWGQQLSDNAVLGLADGTTSVHILEHEMGHGFGFTDFYGGEGESDGFPPGGFPGGGTSIMMAGSSTTITDFDGWFARYAFSKLAAENGRFALTEVPEETTESETETKPRDPGYENFLDFTDTIVENNGTSVTFEEHGTYDYGSALYLTEDQNLANYEPGDRLAIQFYYDLEEHKITSVGHVTLLENSRPETVSGDVNADGTCDILDVIVMQKWLLGLEHLTDWQVGDFDQDQKITVYDFCLLKKYILEK
ncbi:MAG: dockerin type I repeat-containing protein [Oscillospiraceae bacterium]|nr:dockerin type I repeat-containing protein [Oscillospiraceae bacterium]